MCERCEAIDREIQNFKRLHAMADDPLALFMIAEAITDLEQQKAALHPDEKKDAP